MRTDFSNIKVGDKVIISNRNFEYIAEVTKVNKVSFVAKPINSTFTVTFNFFGNERGGDTWNHWFCYEYNEEKANKIHEANKRTFLVNKIKSYRFYELPIDVLENIYKLLSEKTENN